MPFIVRIKPRAEREIGAAAAWWAKNRPAAPGAVLADLQGALSLLAREPGIGSESFEELRSDYLLGASEPNATRAYIARLGDEPIGFIQSYVVMDSGDGWWEDETDPGARGIDQFLADGGQLNQGLGRRMICAFVSNLFSDPEVTVVQTDPDPTNLRAIRCYTAAGFQVVKPVNTPDGPALLMRCTRPFTRVCGSERDLSLSSIGPATALAARRPRVHDSRYAKQLPAAQLNR